MSTEQKQRGCGMEGGEGASEGRRAVEMVCQCRPQKGGGETDKELWAGGQETWALATSFSARTHLCLGPFYSRSQASLENEKA